MIQYDAVFIFYNNSLFEWTSASLHFPVRIDHKHLHGLHEKNNADSLNGGCYVFSPLALSFPADACVSAFSWRKLVRL